MHIHKRVIIPIFAALVICTMAFSTAIHTDYTKEKETKSPNGYSHTFYFKPGMGAGDINKPGAYQASSSGITCSVGSLPCQISVPDGPGTPAQDLAAYLAATAPAVVVSNAISTRP